MNRNCHSPSFALNALKECHKLLLPMELASSQKETRLDVSQQISAQITHQFSQQLTDQLTDQQREDIRRVFFDCLAKLKSVEIKEQRNHKSLSEFLKRLPSWLQGEFDHQHFGMVMRGLERVIEKSLRDDEFLITEKDEVAPTISVSIPLCICLENLQSTFNVGSILRTAEFLGICEVWFCGYTPRPDHELVQKTAMGAEKWLKWKSVSASEIREWQNEFHYVALETSLQSLEHTQPYTQIKPCVLFVGNERYGVSKALLELAHEVRQIQGGGHKNSLNVGVAAGIVASEWKRQWCNQVGK